MSDRAAVIPIHKECANTAVLHVSEPAERRSDDSGPFIPSMYVLRSNGGGGEGTSQHDLLRCLPVPREHLGRVNTDPNTKVRRPAGSRPTRNVSFFPTPSFCVHSKINLGNDDTSTPPESTEDLTTSLSVEEGVVPLTRHDEGLVGADRVDVAHVDKIDAASNAEGYQKIFSALIGLLLSRVCLARVRARATQQTDSKAEVENSAGFFPAAGPEQGGKLCSADPAPVGRDEEEKRMTASLPKKPRQEKQGKQTKWTEDEKGDRGEEEGENGLMLNAEC